MNFFENTLKEIDSFCQINSIEYAIIGGVAVVSYGSFRTTRDVDVTILCEIEDLEKIHGLFIQEFTPILNDSLDFFKKNFVLPLKPKSVNIRIYVIAGLTEFDKLMINRKQRKSFGKSTVFICSLEDLIIYKLFANRLQDLADVEGLIKINKNQLDLNYLLNKIAEFSTIDRKDMLDTLKSLLQQ
ncbi:nucleotidyltransferase [Ignavibacterium sp.]|uniref:nucleotidyltransferase n=1 Tax=Ignavibacterium sp. TaxID=2651167 RepID=UPI00307DC25E